MVEQSHVPSAPEGTPPEAAGGGGPGSAVSDAADVARQILAEHPEYDEVRLLEDDETVPPRPEEEIADLAREQADPADRTTAAGGADAAAPR
ncbi:hypothetical protein [Oerskovia flava]|uniref:hypothetical protein n=1 Tax=Oerskovia flava TaxID=2986422 RepID=UPI002240B185|nr:hypothetical protein [Oerskovia sp. JB1-3-2]